MEAAHHVHAFFEVDVPFKPVLEPAVRVHCAREVEEVAGIAEPHRFYSTDALPVRPRVIFGRAVRLRGLDGSCSTSIPGACMEPSYEPPQTLRSGHGVVG